MNRARWTQLLVGLAATVAVTAVCRLLGSANATTVGFAYLLVVLAVASWFGFPEALAASCAAAAQYNFYFLPPVGTFTIADTRNWVALGSFLITAMVASELSASARRQAREAELRRRDINRLYELTRATLLADPDSITQEIERALVSIFGFRDARLELTRDGNNNAAAPSSTVWPLRVGKGEIGRLRIWGSTVNQEGSGAIAGIVAIALERARVLRESSHLQALRESESLKTALLDAVTHDLRTPLTSIKAAVTALLDREGSTALEASRGDLLAAINEESDHLNHILQTLLDMARVEAGVLRLEPRPQSLAPIVEAAIAQARVDPARVRVRLPPSLPMAQADGPLLSQALAQLLANAGTYSAPHSPIELGAESEVGYVTVTVSDHGTGIPAASMPYIFDKFYRDPQARERRPDGMGMGLAIARGIVAAHHGTIEAASMPGSGARFRLRIPSVDLPLYEHAHSDH